MLSTDWLYVEAEDFNASTPGSGTAAASEWAVFNTESAAGGAAIVAQPNSGVNTGEALIGPRLDYVVNFRGSGTYYVWVRLHTATGNDDSIHLGLDGVPVSLGRSGVTTHLRGDVWIWTNTGGRAARLAVNVTSPGMHTLNLWMREDGTKVDQIVLTQDARFQPDGGRFSTTREQDGVMTIRLGYPDGSSRGTGVTADTVWVNMADFDEGRVMLAHPNAGLNLGDSTSGPRQDYAIDIDAPGTWYVWVRLNGANGHDDSLHVGIDGVPISFGRSGVTTAQHGQWVWTNQGGSAARLAVNIPTAGLHVLNVWMREDGTVASQVHLSRNPDYDPRAGGFVRERDGRVQLEAEHFNGHHQRSLGRWQTAIERALASEFAVVPILSSTNNFGDSIAGPRLDYVVDFATTGRYYVWVRLYGISGSADSVHVGLDGNAVSLGGVGVTTATHGQWVWSNRGGSAARLIVNVSTPGIHVFNLWAREEATYVDQFILTTDGNFVPA